MTDQPLSLARPRAVVTPAAIAAAAGVAAIVALRLAVLFRFRIDSDETWHLHVAWAWTQGLVQYRDLFDNHMPLFHLLSAPLVLLVGERPEALIAGRLAMLPLFALIVMLTYRIAASCYEARAAVWAAAIGALVPGFFLCSVEFRADVLWAALWLAALYVLVAQPVTVSRCATAGLFLGLAAAVSAKTVALAVALILALVLVRGATKCVLVLAGATLVPPSLIAVFFAAMGAWDAFVRGTITHNLIATEHPHRIAYLVPSVAILIWMVRRVQREDGDDELRRRRVFLVLASSIYGALLISLWPIIEREHWLPFYPAFAAAVVPPILGRRPRLVAAVIAVEVLRIVTLAKPWSDRTAPAMQAIAQTLRLTAPHERVIDLKGDLVFRRRASYAMFEKITKKAISAGRMPDTIEADVLRTHAMVATPDDPGFPRSARAFLLRNFIDVGSVRVAGKRVHGVFRIEVPGEYSVMSSNGAFTGSLDGKPYAGPRFLGRGMHTITGTATIIWSRALGGV